MKGTPTEWHSYLKILCTIDGVAGFVWRLAGHLNSTRGQPARGCNVVGVEAMA
jgi:hypothetical protein